MKKIGIALITTILVFFFSLIVLTPIIMNIGYSSVEGSYHAVTHALLASLIFTVIVCTMVVMEEINEAKEESDGDKQNNT